MKIHFIALLAPILFFAGSAWADDLSSPAPVEINGDQVEYVAGENKMIATGHVSVQKGGVTLYCDRLEFDRLNSIGIAEGNVVVIQEGGRLTGERMKYNFNTMQGEFLDATIVSKPFYGGGQKISKVGENHLKIDRGYLTTCDHDEPHFRLISPKIDIYPQDKAVARHVRVMVGPMPVMYYPKFVQDLRGKEPAYLLIPGYDKKWGAFLLTQWRHRFNDYVKATVHADYRQRKDFASGLDIKYDTPEYGSGLVRTYYMNERTVSSRHFLQERLEPTIERERFKGEWRHKWDIDENTNAVLQYYKLSDIDLLKDYFRREYDENPTPPTYFLYTRGFPSGTLSFQTEARVNRFTDAVERLPEINYSLPSQKLGGTQFYWKNETTFSNLAKTRASPSANRQETYRFDTDNEIAYPFKISIFELRPFVGGEETFYSKTKDRRDNNTIRGILKTGADISTKFFKVYDAHTDAFGMNITRLRHVITPSAAYRFSPDPTVLADQLESFDSIDSITRQHVIDFSLENKLQTKRAGKSEDLLRIVLGTDFHLKEDLARGGKGGFHDLKSDIDFRPNRWVTLYADSRYDTISDRLSTANFDLYLNDPNGTWYTSIGKRLSIDVDDQLTTEVGYRFNKKWFFRVYERIDLDSGKVKEQEYSFTRDLHEWEMKISFNETPGEGSEIWMVMTLKDFPDFVLDFGTNFNRRKAGSQRLP
jgi:LPS-assembly protein